MNADDEIVSEGSTRQLFGHFEMIDLATYEMREGKSFVVLRLVKNFRPRADKLQRLAASTGISSSTREPN